MKHLYKFSISDRKKLSCHIGNYTGMVRDNADPIANL